MPNGDPTETAPEIKVYTRDEVAKILKVSPSWVEKLIQRGTLPSILLGGRVRRVRHDDLEAFVARV